MRHYPANSPAAIARIVALTLVSDGRLDAAELAALKKMRAYERIGLNEEEFMRVLHEFCEDLLNGTYCDDRECRLTGDDLVTLLDDLNDPVQQKTVLRLMLEVIRADGRLDKGESLIFWQAIERWGMQISDIVLKIPRKIHQAGQHARAKRKAKAAGQHPQRAQRGESGQRAIFQPA